MKKINGYGWLIQLILFVFAVIYFLGYHETRAEIITQQQIKTALQEYELNHDKQFQHDLTEIKINLQRSLESQGLVWMGD